MLSARSTFYWLWLILFGVVAGLAIWRTRETLSAEPVWMLVTGFLGVRLGERISRPYDLVIGLLLMAVGFLGLLHNLGYSVVPANASTANLIDQSAILGLSLELPYALIHTLLGLNALNHGLRARSQDASVTVETSSNSA